MLLNRDSRGWIIASVLIAIVATVLYVPYAHHDPTGPSGGRIQGIIYGSVGFGMMLFAMLLGARKTVRTMRIGRVYIWMQGHVWLGLLAYPIIFFHAGMHWGQAWSLTWLLMWLFTIVIASGIVGIIIQQYMPTKLLRDVPMETIYEQIEHVLGTLRKDADDLVDGVIKGGGGEAFEQEVVPAGAGVATLEETAVKAAKSLKDFYDTDVRPFLADKPPRGSKLSTDQGVRAAFETIRGMFPLAEQEPIVDLQAIVEERRQLLKQKRMHHILHGWLIVHVPISYGLMILATYHAIHDLRYVMIRW